MVFRFIWDYLDDQRIADKIAASLIALAFLCIALFFFGAFSSRAEIGVPGLGDASMNINSFFNPQGTSYFLRDLPLAAKFQYEGYGYLGFGMLCICFFFFMDMIADTHSIKKKLEEKTVRTNAMLVLLLAAAFALLALSPVITFNGHVLFSYYVPVVNSVWSIFRSTGRYVWVLMYLVMFSMLWLIYRRFGAKKGLAVLCFVLFFQHIDLRGFFSRKGQTFKTDVDWDSPLESGAWANLAVHKKHIFYIESPADNMWAIMDFAVKHSLTLNDAYLARKNWKQIEAFKNEEKERILAGNADAESIYIFTTEKEAGKYSSNLDISVLDEVIVGVKSGSAFLPAFGP